MKETLKTMKEMIISQTQPQVANLQCANHEELGAAIDMIKDLEEALYYCAIIEAMEAKDKEKEDQPIERNNTYYYTEKYMPVYDDRYYRDMDRMYGKMYYSGSGGSSGGSGGNSGGSSGGNSGGSSGGNSGGGSSGSRNYSDRQESSSSWGNEGSDGRMNYYQYPVEMRDSREGRSPMSRRNYMESKNTHSDKNKQLKELETYMQELTTDITEMLEGASPEEKQLLQKKLSFLSSKVESLK